jgi:hypothetical protein
VEAAGLLPLKKYRPDQQEHFLETYPKFLVSRHPFERLISAYRDKFETNSVYTEVFQKRYGKHILSQSKEKNFTFTNFVKFITDPSLGAEQKMDEHWAPYTSLCLPCYVDYSYVIRYDSFLEDAGFVLRLLFNSTLDAFPYKNSASQQHKDYLASLNATQLSDLWNMYAQDFRLFEYD